MSRILVIDDNVLLSEMLKEALAEQGYAVGIALDANEGYAIALQFHPDLILLDVQLPDVAGFDLLRVIKNREELKQVPIIMITGTHGQTDHKVKAFQAGADDYVLKPFEMPELLERIKAVLRRTESKRVEPPVDLAMSSPATTGGGPAVGSRQPNSGMAHVTSREGKNSTALGLMETVRQIIACPDSLVGKSHPSVTLLYIASLMGLSLGGWAFSAGSSVKPALIGMGTAGFWGLCVAFLVITSSVMGISLTWNEGARIICLSGLPLLLKLTGALVMTLATSLTPFYFTASPAIFMKSASLLWQRLDIFELWMVWLIYTFVRQCKGSSRQKAAIAAAVVWPVLAYWQSLWKH